MLNSAIAERVYGILKNEFDLNREFNDREQALEVVENTIEVGKEGAPSRGGNKIKYFNLNFNLNLYQIGV